jgi:zinc transport system permease protein
MTFPAIMRGMPMTEWLDDFLLRSFLAGLIMITIAAPMGCLMVWQRLAFLSDTLGHAAVLGVGIGLMLQLQPVFGVLAVALLIVYSLGRISSFNTALSETALAIISHTGLAGGIILIGLLPVQTVNLEALLFGDLLATTHGDLVSLLATTLVLLVILRYRWRSFVALSVSREIAQAEGIEVRRMQFLMFTMIALLVAVMMKGRATVGDGRVLPFRLANRPRDRGQRHCAAVAEPRPAARGRPGFTLARVFHRFCLPAPRAGIHRSGNISDEIDAAFG